jgi:DNA polymerase-3 subunit epsilon
LWIAALAAALTLGRVGGLWRVAASGRVKTTYQFKVNSGASNLISRAAASATLRGPGTLVTNIAVPSLVAGGHALHFLPDRLLVRSGRHFSDVSYGSLQIACAAQRFIEDGRVPRDATQVDTTWRYVNVNGTPDRRFNNNAQLPVMLYGRWELASANGLEWIVDCSRLDVTERVESLMRAAPMPTAERGPDLVAT